MVSTRKTGKPSKEAKAITTGKTLAHKRKKGMSGNARRISKRLQRASKTAVKRASSNVKKRFRGKPGHWKEKTKKGALNSLATTYNRIVFSCNMLKRNKDPKHLLAPRDMHRLFH